MRIWESFSDDLLNRRLALDVSSATARPKISEKNESLQSQRTLTILAIMRKITILASTVSRCMHHLVALHLKAFGCHQIPEMCNPDLELCAITCQSSYTTYNKTDQSKRTTSIEEATSFLYLLGMGSEFSEQTRTTTR